MSDWSSDVCASDIDRGPGRGERLALAQGVLVADGGDDGLRKPEGAAVGGAGAGGAAEGRARLVVAQGVERGPVERDDGGGDLRPRLQRGDDGAQGPLGLEGAVALEENGRAHV